MHGVGAAVHAVALPETGCVAGVVPTRLAHIGPAEPVPPPPLLLPVLPLLLLLLLGGKLASPGYTEFLISCAIQQGGVLLGRPVRDHGVVQVHTVAGLVGQVHLWASGSHM